MKLRLLINSEVNQAIQGLMLKASVEDAHRLLKAYQSVVSAQEDFQNLRTMLITKHGKKAEDGSILKSEDGSNFLLDNEVEFIKEYEDLLNLEIKLNLPKSVAKIFTETPK